MNEYNIYARLEYRWLGFAIKVRSGGSRSKSKTSYQNPGQWGGASSTLSSTWEAGLSIDTHFNVTYVSMLAVPAGIGGPINGRAASTSLELAPRRRANCWVVGQLARNFHHSGCNLWCIVRYSRRHPVSPQGPGGRGPDFFSCPSLSLSLSRFPCAASSAEKTRWELSEGHSTHEAESPWPVHFKHSHWWKRRSRSKFATSHHAWGTNGVYKWMQDGL